MFEDVYLQTPGIADAVFFSWIAILIAGISAAAVTCSFLLNWRISVKENNRKYSELINTLQNQLNQLLDREYAIKTPESFMQLIYQYLNKVEEIAYLTLKDKIPSDISEYFIWWLKDAYSIIVTLDKKEITDDVFHKETWRYLLDWKKKYFPETKEFYPKDESPLFLIRLNYLLKNSKK